MTAAAPLRSLPLAEIKRGPPNAVKIRCGPDAVSQRLAAAAAGVRFQNLPCSVRLTVGAAGRRVRIAFEVEEDARIDDIECLLKGLVDEVRAMRMRDKLDGQEE